MNCKFRLSSLLWLAPFASFILGYAGMLFIYQNKTIETPALLGKTIDTALITTSTQHLNIRITDTKYDADLPAGTILSQIPAPGKLIKENQTIYAVITQKPAAFLMPDLHNKNEHDLRALLVNAKAKVQIISIENDHPNNTCLAQYPQATEIAHNDIIIYLAKEPEKMVIMPNLYQKPLDDVMAFLSLHGITPMLLSTDQSATHTCADCKIIDQRPQPGSIIAIAGPHKATIQLQLAHT